MLCLFVACAHHAPCASQQDWSTFINIFAAERVPTTVIEVIETGYVSTMRDLFSDLRKYKNERSGLQKAADVAGVAVRENQADLDHNSQTTIDLAVAEMNGIQPEGDNSELTEEQQKKIETLRGTVAEMRGILASAQNAKKGLDDAKTTADGALATNQGSIDKSSATLIEGYSAFFAGDTRFATVGSTRRNTN